MREWLKETRRIVVKAGTSILTSPKGKISKKSMERLGSEIMACRKQKKEVALVSSGAIAFGMEAGGWKKRPKEMARLQAAASIGQGKLMHAYEQFFSKKKVHTAQLLLTRDGLETRKRFLTARHTFNELFRMKVLPIVNENDSVSNEEIAFGDNDILSVQVAHLIHADLLIILSDVEGFYLRDGSRIRDVQSESEIDGQLVKHLKDTHKEKTVGGMRAKLQAARVAMRLGVPLMIVSGHENEIIQKVLNGKDVGTAFHASKVKRDARRKWIAFSAARKGTLVVDSGASKALKSHKRSLLASGIVKVEGRFDRDAVVELETTDGNVLGRGVVRYSYRELEKIAGKKSNEIQNILGYKHRDEVIHRNDMVLWA